MGQAHSFYKNIRMKRYIFLVFDGVINIQKDKMPLNRFFR